MKNKEYTIYGTTDCIYCKQAIELLDSLGYPYSYIHATESEAFKELFISKGVRTVPQIFEITFDPFKEEHVGGYEELVERLV